MQPSVRGSENYCREAFAFDAAPRCGLLYMMASFPVPVTESEHN